MARVASALVWMETSPLALAPGSAEKAREHLAAGPPAARRGHALADGRVLSGVCCVSDCPQVPKSFMLNIQVRSRRQTNPLESVWQVSV